MKATCRGCVALALLGSICFNNAAKADTLGPFCEDWGPVAVDSAPFSIQLPRFNPALGTLQKVILELEATTDSGSITFDSESPNPASITLGIGATVTATAPSSLTLVAIPMQSNSGSITADDEPGTGNPDFLGTDSFTVVGGSGSDDDNDELTTGLTPYIATFLGETFDVDIELPIQFMLLSTATGQFSHVPGQAYGEVCVTYEYEPAVVPEPSTIALAFGSAAAMVFFARRRRS